VLAVGGDIVDSTDFSTGVVYVDDTEDGKISFIVDDVDILAGAGGQDVVLTVVFMISPDATGTIENVANVYLTPEGGIDPDEPDGTDDEMVIPIGSLGMTDDGNDYTEDSESAALTPRPTPRTPSELPVTGDSFHLMGWCLLLGVCIRGIAILIVRILREATSSK
jgi:hypothetical protein